MPPIFANQPIPGCFFSFRKKLSSDFERIHKKLNEIVIEKALSISYIWGIAPGTQQLEFRKEKFDELFKDLGGTQRGGRPG
jgi:hypothetical protein